MSWKYFFGVNIILKFEKLHIKYWKQIIEKKKKNLFHKVCWHYLLFNFLKQLSKFPFLVAWPSTYI